MVEVGLLEDGSGQEGILRADESAYEYIVSIVLQQGGELPELGCVGVSGYDFFYAHKIG